MRVVSVVVCGSKVRRLSLGADMTHRRFDGARWRRRWVTKLGGILSRVFHVDAAWGIRVTPVGGLGATLCLGVADLVAAETPWTRVVRVDRHLGVAWLPSLPGYDRQVNNTAVAERRSTIGSLGLSWVSTTTATFRFGY